MKLNDKYICEIQNHKRCFIKEDRHLSLTNFTISLWAKEIVCIYSCNYYFINTFYNNVKIYLL